MNESSPAAILRERAGFQPNQKVFTFIDYEQDWDGVAESLTWAQLYRRTTNVARELKRSGSPGDRAVISAPQGLDYIVAFYGAMQAGLIPVPLSVPLGGVTDERVDSVLRDSSPTVVLTTSAVIDNVNASIRSQGGQSAPAVVAVDLLDLDSRERYDASGDGYSDIAFLQYTSGSTRTPAGVMVSNKNLMTNYGQLMADLFADDGNLPPPDTTIVSWLPFYHDMGLMVGIFVPVLAGLHAVVISPFAFLQRPARWMQLLASNRHAFSSAPNFAFEIAAKKTSDDDMAGLDLGEVRGIGSGSERINPATIKRFTDRFARFNLRDTALRPGYGLAEATVYAATGRPNQLPKIVRFDSDKLTAGRAERCESGGTPLVSYGVPQSPTVRVVDPDTRTECPAGMTGEIWVHGENVALGYWQKPDETENTFRARLVAPSAGTPEGPWLRTGDQGFLFEDELFVIGRIKDLLIVYGRNHSPDDIEATIQEITAGRCAAIAVPDGHTEKLVVIAEVKKRGASPEEAADKLTVVRREVTSAISNAHGLSIADLVMVSPGAIPITTSGKVRRATCVDQYRQNQFARVDA